MSNNLVFNKKSPEKSGDRIGFGKQLNQIELKNYDCHQNNKKQKLHDC